MFMTFARAASLRSTCYRGNTGAVITMNDNVISIGYNGPPSGHSHCKGNGCETKQDGGCKRSIHAEHNAIRRMPESLKLNGEFKTMYVTTSPCPACAGLIAGELDIKTVIFENEYRIPDGWKYLIKWGINAYRLSPSGYLVNMRTNEVSETR